MSRRIFWDVDTQYDFMRADGKLYVPGAEEIIPHLARLRAYAKANHIRTIATADDHVVEHPEISDQPDFKDTFPPHCMRGTTGQQKISETRLDAPLLVEPMPLDPAALRQAVRGHPGDILFHKHWFDIFTNPNVECVLEELDPDEIVLFGVALDVCNRFAVEGLLSRRPATSLRLIVDATRAIDPDEGARLLDHWRGRGVQLTTTKQILGEPVSRAATSR